MSRSFDLDKLDFEAIRLARRKRLLLLSLPIVIIVLLAGGKLVSTVVVDTIGSSQYQSGLYAQSTKTYGFLRFINLIEPYKAHYNMGTSQAQDAKYTKAQRSFEDALRANPPTEAACDIRLNWSLSLEMPADELVGKEKYDEAIAMYQQAITVLRDGNCNNAAKQGKKAKVAEERIAKKLSDAKQLRNGDEPTEPDDQKDPNKDQPNDEQREDQLDELDRRMKNAQTDRNDTREFNENYDEGKTAQGQTQPSDTPW